MASTAPTKKASTQTASAKATPAKKVSKPAISKPTAATGTSDAAPPKNENSDVGANIKQGRTATLSVRAYLDHMATPRRRTRTKAQVTERIDAINTSLQDEKDNLARLRLIQQRVDLTVELANAPDMTNDDAASALEEDFVSAAVSYSDKNGVSYSAWREIGVPASVLTKCGIKRTRIPK